MSRLVLLLGLLLVAANLVVGQQGRTLLGVLGQGSTAGANKFQFPTGPGTEAGKAVGALPPPGQTTMPVPVTGFTP